MTGAMVLGLAGCGGNNGGGASGGTADGGGETFDFSGTKIGILGYHQSGEPVDALNAYLDRLSEEIGFEYEYVIGSSYDEQTNITNIQNMISSGCSGIIYCMDSGTPTIVEECESAGVYLAGWECDFEESFDKIKSNEMFLGNICDGTYDRSKIGETAAELAIKDGCKNIGIVTFPAVYYPHTKETVDTFCSAIDEYNQTADEPIEVYEPMELSFTELDDTYFSTYPDVDGILGLASGFVYPTMVRTNHTDVKLYSTGMLKDQADAFRKGHIKMGCNANTEAIVYPLALLLNQISGQQFADKPSEAERVDTSFVYVTDEESLDAVNEKSMLYTCNADDTLIPADEFKTFLTAYNEEASYESLKQRMVEMEIDAFMD